MERIHLESLFFSQRSEGLGYSLISNGIYSALVDPSGRDAIEMTLSSNAEWSNENCISDIRGNKLVIVEIKENEE